MVPSGSTSGLELPPGQVGLCPSVVFLPVLYRFLAGFPYVHRRPVPAVITELTGMGITGKPSWFLTAANAEVVAHKPKHPTHLYWRADVS